MDINSLIKESNKTSNESIRYVNMMYDSLELRVNLLMVASIFPFILVPFIDLYIPSLFLNAALLFVLAIFDYRTLIDLKGLDKDLAQYKKNINKLYDSYSLIINRGEYQT